MADAQRLAEIRSWLTAYADGVQGHGITDFGGRVAVTSVAEGEVYRLGLESVYESRSLQVREDAYDGAGPRTPSVAGPADVWGQEFPLPGPISDGMVQDRPVLGTEETVPCGGCGVTGRVACGACGGQGQAGCDTCDGKGKVKCGTTAPHAIWGAFTINNITSPLWSCSGAGTVRCKECGGEGTKKCDGCSGAGENKYTRVGAPEEVRCPECVGTGSPPFSGGARCFRCYGRGYTNERVRETYSQPCERCRGVGKVECLACDCTGKVACSACEGKGKVRCWKCEGKKQITCVTCSGEKSVSCQQCKGQKYLAVCRRVISRSFRIRRSDGKFAVGVGQGAVAGVKEDDLQPVADVSGDRLDAGTPLSDVPQAVAGWASAEIGQAHAASSTESRLLRQRLAVSKCMVTEVEYAYGGKSYRICFVGQRHRPVAAVSPISEWVEQERQRLGRATEERRQQHQRFALREQEISEGVAAAEKQIKEQEGSLAKGFGHWFRGRLGFGLDTALVVSLAVSLIGFCCVGPVGSGLAGRWEKQRFKDEVAAEHPPDIDPKVAEEMWKERLWQEVGKKVLLLMWCVTVPTPWVVVCLAYLVFRLTVDQAKYQEELDRTVNAPALASIDGLKQTVASLMQELSYVQAQGGLLAAEIQRLGEEDAARQRQAGSLLGHPLREGAKCSERTAPVASIPAGVIDPDLAALIEAEREEEKARREADRGKSG